MIQELPTSFSGRATCSGRHSTWLHKTKGGNTLSKWFQPSGRRWYTIDFDCQTLFYTHNAESRHVSVPVPFADILGATLGEEGKTPSATPKLGRSFSKGFLTSSAEPSVHASGRGSPPLHHFVIETRQKRVRLAAEREHDAALWVEMLNSASLIGKGECTAKQLRPTALKQERKPVIQLSPEFRCPPMRQRDEEAAIESEGAKPSSVKSDSQGSQRSTLLAETGSERPWSECSEAESVDGDGRVLASFATEAAQELAHVMMRDSDGGVAPGDHRMLVAADFGFDGDVPEDGSPDPSPVSTPRAVAEFSLEHALEARDADASDDDSECEGDRGALEARARADLLLAQRQANPSAMRPRARKSDKKSRHGQGHDEKAAKLHAWQVAADLSHGDAESASRITADLMLADRFRPASRQCPMP